MTQTEIIALGVFGVLAIALHIYCGERVRHYKWNRMKARRHGDAEPKRPPWWIFLLGS